MRPRAALATLLWLFALAPSAAAEELVVIVHRDRTVAPTPQEVGQIFLRQRRFWADGESIVPVNRDSASAARAAFERMVFGDAARNLVVYWNRQYFRGVLPPATLASDEAVRGFVARERRAIGYVAPHVVDDSVRAVLHLRLP